MGKVNANFNFKVFGLANDENGNESYGYINVFPKDKEGKDLMIEQEEYADMHDAFAKMLSSQLGLDFEKIELITEEEYLLKTEPTEEQR